MTPFNSVFSIKSAFQGTRVNGGSRSFSHHQRPPQQSRQWGQTQLRAWSQQTMEASGTFHGPGQGHFCGWKTGEKTWNHSSATFSLGTDLTPLVPCTLHAICREEHLCLTVLVFVPVMISLFLTELPLNFAQHCKIVNKPAQSREIQ